MTVARPYNPCMASSDKLLAFVEAIRVSGLLSNADMEALVRAAGAPDADPETLARDLVQRRVLTALQVRRLWSGRGVDLVLNQYLLLDRIGEGGMGEVFRARHTRLDRDVALKVMKKEKMANPEAVRRFRREIRAAAALAHENVVRAYDADQSGDIHYFAMEFVDGTTLDRMVREKGPLPVPDACDYIRQAALGLQHAYERGLTHRDVKPANLLLDKSGVVKISDLGLVLIGDPDTGEPGSRITKEGLTVGTPDYVAPEQARNPRAADVRADIYALGCTLYYLLQGDVPFPGGTATEKMLRHAREPVPAPTREGIHPGVLAILASMTAKKPEQRYSTPAEVAAVLAPYAGHGAPPDTPPPQPAVSDKLTDDELPTPTLRLPRIPSRTEKPKGRKGGCLGILLLGAAIGVVIGRLA
jgi:eukaryotic-like serine/threonine-protein kinase